jgi:hypothetical protein
MTVLTKRLELAADRADCQPAFVPRPSSWYSAQSGGHAHGGTGVGARVQARQPRRRQLHARPAHRPRLAAMRILRSATPARDRRWLRADRRLHAVVRRTPARRHGARSLAPRRADRRAGQRGRMRGAPTLTRRLGFLTLGRTSPWRRMSFGPSVSTSMMRAPVAQSVMSSRRRVDNRADLLGCQPLRRLPALAGGFNRTRLGCTRATRTGCPATAAVSRRRQRAMTDCW